MRLAVCLARSHLVPFLLKEEEINSAFRDLQEQEQRLSFGVLRGPSTPKQLPVVNNEIFNHCFIELVHMEVVRVLTEMLFQQEQEVVLFQQCLPLWDLQLFATTPRSSTP